MNKNTNREFIQWIAESAMSEDWKDDGAFWQEMILRKLVKLGVIEFDGKYYKYTTKEEDRHGMASS